MPWDAQSFRARHNGKLSSTEAGHAASIANAILKRTGDEGLAISTANKRASKRADGGVMEHADGGLLVGATKGRADKIETTAPEGSYVVPADVVSGLGEGNTIAGAKVIETLFGGAGKGDTPVRLYRGGGMTFEEPGRAPVMLSDGEVVLSPQQVAAFGGGDHARGVKKLDLWTVQQRRRNIARLRKLPGPVKSKGNR